MKQQDVGAFSGSYSDVESFRKAEILRETDESDVGKLFIEIVRAVGRAVIYNEDLVVVAQAFEALAEVVDAIENETMTTETRFGSMTSGSGIKGLF